MEEKEIDLRDYINVILKRKKMILWIFFIAVVTSAIVSLFLPKVYEASVTLMITKPKYQVALEPKIQTLVSTEVSIETYTNLIKDRNLEEAVIKELIKIDPAYKNLTGSNLQGLITIKSIKDTHLIELIIKSNSPMKAKQIANTWAKLFVETNQELGLKETKEAQTFINKQLEVTEQSLTELEEEMRQFNETNQISILEQKIDNNITQIVEYETRLDELGLSYEKKLIYLKTTILEFLRKYIRIIQKRIADINLSLLKSESGLVQLKKQLKRRDAILNPQKYNVNNEALDVITSSSNKSKLMVSKIGLDPIYFDLELQEVNLSISQGVLATERDSLEKILVAFEELLNETEIEIKDKNLTVEQLLQLANNVTGRISEKSVINEKKEEQNEDKLINRNEIGETLLKKQVVTSFSLEEEVVNTILSIEILLAEIKQTKIIIDQLNKALDKYKIRLGNEKLEFTQLTRAADKFKGTYQVLSQKAEETRIAAATKPGLIKIVKDAYAPRSPIRPNKRRNVLIAGMAGLMFGIFLAFLMEYLGPKED